MKEILSMIFPLVVVILMIVAAYYKTKWIAEKQKAIMSGKIIRVIERVALGKDTYLLIISVDGRPYLVSASNNGVHLLESLPEELLEKYEKAGSVGDSTSQFAALLCEKLTGKRDRDGTGK